jgi:hypothetical protein
MKKLFILAVVVIGRVFSYGTPPPPPPPCDTPQCSGGTYCFSNTNVCTPCPPGYMYNANPNVGVSSVNLWGCTPCPPGTFSPASGSGSCTSCVSGTFAPASGSTGCSACPSGTFTAASGQSGCTRCTSCVLGQYIASGCTGQSNTVCVSCHSIARCAVPPTCSTASNSQCAACVAGFVLQNNACVACTTCSNGIQYETSACTSARDRQCAACTNTCPVGSALQGACSGTANPSCVPCATGSYKALADGSACVPCTTTCNPGFQLQAICSASINAVCTACPTGSYKVLFDGSACLPCTTTCAPGFHLNQACTATVNPQCIPCPAGSYKAFADGSACLPCTTTCAPGFHLNQACTAAVNPQCVPCPAGSYKAFADGSACLPCTATCEPGYQLNQACIATVNPVCTGCASGTYKMVPDGSACVPCNNNCGPGAYLDSLCAPINNPVCVKCPANTANALEFSVFNTDCIACPEGSISLAGSASCIQCPLGSATFGNSNCTQCLPGTYADQIGSIFCKFCPVGTAHATTAATNSSACLTCPPGHTALAGSDRCSPCLEGLYETGLRRCLACPRGTYTDIVGQTACIPCPAGTAHNTVAAATVNACLACEAGTFAPAGSTVCTPCLPGSFTNTTGQADCMLAPPGTFIRGNGSTTLEACGPGFYTDQLGATRCEACVPGTFSRAAHAVACLPCPVGTASNTSGNLACTDTAVGFYQDTPGAVNGVPCPAGTFNGLTGATKASACLTCSAGQYQPHKGSALCLVCPVGMYQDAIGKTDCLLCPSGTYNTRVGATALNDCLACPIGTYSSVVGALTCMPSPLGTYSARPGAGNYTPCPPGFYQNITGQSTCTACPPGTFNGLAGMPQSSFCLPSPPGFFVFLTGTPTAVACPPGSWNDKHGATGCELCLPGSFTNQAGATRCTPCPVGTFGLSAGLVHCDPLGVPTSTFTNISADAGVVTVRTNFTATFPLPYTCSQSCMFFVNTEPVSVRSGTGLVLLAVRPGVDEITVMYNGTFASPLALEWTCFAFAGGQTRCTAIIANTVLTAVTLMAEKALLNPYADPQVLFARTLRLTHPTTQTYVFPLKGLEAAVNYTFTLLLSMINATAELPPFSLGTMATLPGSPTGPVQHLVKHFLGLAVAENAQLEQANLQVHWEPPTLEHQHGPILNYKVEYVQEARTFITYGPQVETVVTPVARFSFLTTNTTVILSDLRPDTAYTITVYPFTAAPGAGPGQTLVLRTQVSAPSKPPVLTLVKRDETKITVSWSNLTNATGVITKIWIVIEPYEAGTSEADTSEAGTSEAGTSEAGTSEVVIVPLNNSALPLLPFPHEHTRGFFGPYNVSHPCQDEIIGYTFRSLKSNVVCGGMCATLCEFGTPMLDPTTILATNDQNLTNDNFLMAFNTTDGNASVRFVPYLSMKKRFALNSTNGGLAGFGQSVLGDGKINPNSLLNNTRLLPTLAYRVRFIVFTSEVLYAISDPLDVPPLTFPSQVDAFTATYMALIIVIVLLVLACMCFICVRKCLKRHHDTALLKENKQYLASEILKYTNSKDSITYCNMEPDVPMLPPDVPMLPPKDSGLYKTTTSVTNPFYWMNIYSPEYLDRTNKPIYTQLDKPIYAHPKTITDGHKYMDVSKAVNNKFFSEDRYFDVTASNNNINAEKYTTIYEDEENENREKKETIYDVPVILNNKDYTYRN